MSNTTQPNRPNEEPRSISFDSQEFALFELWIDDQLDVLEDRWIDHAAPNAARNAERNYLQKTRG